MSNAEHAVLADILGSDFEIEIKTGFQYQSLQDLNSLDAPLPRQVEVTCDIFHKRFIMTADRLAQTAGTLERMAADLRQKEQNIRDAATSLPETIREWVLVERRYVADAQFFDSIVK